MGICHLRLIAKPLDKVCMVHSFKRKNLFSWQVSQDGRKPICYVPLAYNTVQLWKNPQFPSILKSHQQSALRPFMHRALHMNALFEQLFFSVWTQIVVTFEDEQLLSRENDFGTFEFGLRLCFEHFQNTHSHSHNQLNLGNYSQESNHGQLFRPSLGSSAWYSLYVNWAAAPRRSQRTPSMVSPTVTHVGLGLDTNISKFGLNIFREILEKSSKYLQKFSKYLPKFSKYLKISRKFRILIRWRILVSKPQCRQRLSRHSIWRMQYHVNACTCAGKKLIIDATSVTHWWLIFKKVTKV